MPSPRWLVAAHDASDLDRAAGILAREGHVVVLAGLTIKGLPPPLPEEDRTAATSPHARGHLIRRGVARAVAARALGGGAADHALTQTHAGQPRFVSAGLQVSFSARGDIAAIALGRRPLGVDYETRLPPAGIPGNILRAEERAALEQLPLAAREAAFLSLWRAKEATLKAHGFGFLIPPEEVCIDLPGAASRITSLSPPLHCRLLETSDDGVTLALT